MPQLAPRSSHLKKCSKDLWRFLCTGDSLFSLGTEIKRALLLEGWGKEAAPEEAQRAGSSSAPRWPGCSRGLCLAGAVASPPSLRPSGLLPREAQRSRNFWLSSRCYSMEQLQAAWLADLAQFLHYSMAESHCLPRIPREVYQLKKTGRKRGLLTLSYCVLLSTVQLLKGTALRPSGWGSRILTATWFFRGLTKERLF